MPLLRCFYSPATSLHFLFSAILHISMYQLPIPNFYYYLLLPSCVPPSLLFISVMLDGLLPASTFCPLFSPSPFFVCLSLHAASAFPLLFHFLYILSFTIILFLIFRPSIIRYLLFFTYLRVLIPHLLYVFDLFLSDHSRHNRSLILFSLFFTYLFSPIFPFIFYTSLSTNSCFPTILYLSSYLIFLNSHIFLLPYISPTICIHAT